MSKDNLVKLKIQMPNDGPAKKVKQKLTWYDSKTGDWYEGEGDYMSFSYDFKQKRNVPYCVNLKKKETHPEWSRLVRVVQLIPVDFFVHEISKNSHITVEIEEKLADEVIDFINGQRLCNATCSVLEE